MKRRRLLAALCAVLLLSGIFLLRHHFTPQRWQSQRDRGNLVNSLLYQYDDLSGMTAEEVAALLGEPTSAATETAHYYWIGSGRGLEWFPEYMVVRYADGRVWQVEFVLA